MQWVKCGSSSAITFPISFSSTNYAGSWMEEVSTWVDENMSRRQMQVKNKSKTGFTLYAIQSNRWYCLIGY